MSRNLLSNILEFKSIPVEETIATAGEVYVNLFRAKVSLEYIEANAPDEKLRKEAHFALMKVNHDIEIAREISDLFRSMK
ncbi:hypothetical protein D3C87_124880 [compost metagenome]